MSENREKQHGGADFLERMILLSWTGAEGEQEGRPLLIRFRDIGENLFRPSGCKRLIVVTYSYPIQDQTGLPSSAQYKSVEDFEKRVFDTLERAVAAVMVFAKTCAGRIEYMVYSQKSADQLQNVLGVNLKDSDPVEFSETEDPHWEIYLGDKSMVSP